MKKILLLVLLGGCISMAAMEKSPKEENVYITYTYAPLEPTTYSVSVVKAPTTPLMKKSKSPKSELYLDREQKRNVAICAGVTGFTACGIAAILCIPC